MCKSPDNRCKGWFFSVYKNVNNVHKSPFKLEGYPQADENPFLTLFYPQEINSSYTGYCGLIFFFNISNVLVKDSFLLISAVILSIPWIMVV